MLTYITRRIAFSLPVLLGVSIGIFILLRAIPGDPVAAQSGESLALSKAHIQAFRADLGLNKPLYEQYLIWMRDLLRGNGGESLVHHNASLHNVISAVPVSLEIALAATVVGLLIAVPFGVLTAVKRNSWVDYTARGFVVVGLSVPEFLSGTLILIYVALWFKWTIPFGYSSLWSNPSRNIQQFFIPVLLLGFRLSASTLRFTRASMLEVLNDDYVRTARAKGLREYRVVMAHAFRCAVIPVITVVGVQMAYLLGGTVIMETLFSLPGIGLLTINAVRQLDYTQVQTAVMFFAVTTVLVNLLVDVTYAALDPRISAN